MYLEQINSWFPYNIIGLAFLIFILSFLINRRIEREKKIVRYINIVQFFNNEDYHHGEAVFIRHELGMTHDEILAKAPRIIERNNKLLVNNPA